jgi:acylglycerol lipase
MTSPSPFEAHPENQPETEPKTDNDTLQKQSIQQYIHKDALGIVRPLGFPELPAHWQTEWETYKGTDERNQLFWLLHHRQDWNGERVLLVLHGLGEHGGRYLHLPHYLQSEVGAVCCPDHLGHGRSEGLRGHAEHFDTFADDAALAIQRLDDLLMRRFGRSEIHLLGHSMGGLIALRTLIRHPNVAVRSVTLSAPLLRIKQEVPWIKHAAAKVLRHVWGTMQMESEIDARLLSHDPAVAEAYRMDRLVHGKGTPRMYTSMMEAMEDTLRHESGFTHPMRFLVPLADEIVDSEATLEFYQRLRHRDKDLKTYEGYYHEIFNERGKEKPLEDLVSWIRAHALQKLGGSAGT